VVITHTNVQDQAHFVEAMALRVRKLASALNFNAKTLGDEIGIGKSAMSNYWTGKRSFPTEALPRLADRLNTNVDYLLRGVPSALAAVDADAVDWVVVPEFDLRELSDESRGPIISETPFRKDWLQRMLGMATGLWLARMPAEYPALNLGEGDLVFVRDVLPGEATDRALYVVRIDGTLTVARLDALASTESARGDRLGERVLSFRNFGYGDGKAIPIARVLGVPLMRI